MGGSSEVTTGYWYGMGMHLVVCQGPVDAVTRIDVGDRLAWLGSMTANGSVAIDEPTLFGGEKKEGGVVGTVEVLMGGPTQQPNGYLMSKIGVALPAWRGLLSLVLQRPWLSANSQYFKPWAITARRILQGWHGGTAWYEAKAAVGAHGDMNPAHIIYQCLTDPRWGMGYHTTSTGDTFTAAADTLYSEGFGLSLAWTQQATVEDFVQTVQDHIGGALYVNPRTGKFELKLIRGDYDPQTIPVLGPSEISEVSEFQRGAWGEMVNEITVSFTDRDTHAATAITVQDLASVASQGAVVNATRSYPGIRDPDLAARVAMRDLAAASAPLAKVKLKTNRIGWDLHPGAVFKLVWPDLGIESLICRVLQISTGTQLNGEISIDVAEDVFGLPANSYVQQTPVSWTDPATQPAPCPEEVLLEAPYWDIHKKLAGDMTGVESDTAYLITLGKRPSSDAADYDLQTKPYGGTYTHRARGSFTPTATLLDALPAERNSIAATLENATDLDRVTVGTLALLGDELVQVSAIDDQAPTVTLARGMLDTPPVPHDAGTRIWFYGSAAGYDPTEWSQETIYAKLLPLTTYGELPLADATERSRSMTRRQYRAYAPGKYSINGMAYPPAISGYDPLTLEWAHRDRLQQTLTLITQDGASIGPESGVTYTVRIVDRTTSSVLKTVSGLTGTAAAISQIDLGSSAEIRAEVYAIRDGYESHKRHISDFTRVDESGNPITEGFGSGEASEICMYDGTQFIVRRSATYNNGMSYLTRYFGSSDGGATYEYLGSGASLSTLDTINVRAPIGYANFSKSKAAIHWDPNDGEWWHSITPTVAAAYPPSIVSYATIAGTEKPLCIAWDDANSRFVRMMDTKYMYHSADGLAWTVLGALSLPSLGRPWTWHYGMWWELHKIGSYWYAFHAEGKTTLLTYTAQDDQTGGGMLMRSTDLLNWTACPGSGFLFPPVGITWEFFMGFGFAYRGNTMVITGWAKRAEEGAVAKEIILRSTDGFNFALAREEEATYTGWSTSDYKEIKPVGTAGFAAAGPAGLLASADDGVTWTETVMLTYPTNMRSDGANVIASRATASNGANEPWYTTDGTNWSKATILGYRAGTYRHWRVRAISSPGSIVTFAELAFFDGATKHTSYTASQGAGSDLAYVDDADPATYWTATSTHIAAGTAWVAFDFGSAVNVTSVELQAPPSGAVMPYDVEIEASADGTSWTPIWFESGLTWAASENKRLEKV